MARWWKISPVLLLLWGSEANAAPEGREVLASSICASAETEAKANGLDPSFFARLLWRESLFDPNVVSDKGAQGIAQFMPETAARRGLKDPLEPMAAVKASAAYLADLKKMFGNMGLAAAAYNAGEDRVARWLAGKSGLPAETESYVAFVTGHEVQEWKSPTADFTIPAIGPRPDFTENCVALASRKEQLAGTHLPSAPYAPWGALVAVDFSETRAVAMFHRLKLRFPQALANRDPLILYRRNLSRGTRSMAYVMVGESSRVAATQSCQALNAAGAPCVVQKN
jgi:Transglycosylase SLT domain